MAAPVSRQTLGEVTGNQLAPNSMNSTNTGKADVVDLTKTSDVATNLTASTVPKRKVDDITASGSESGSESDSDDGMLMNPIESCNQVRAKIRRFLDAKEMKVGEFQKAINCSSPAYSRFMNQNGPHKGEFSDVYIKAFNFFQKRQAKGIKIPGPKKAKKLDAKEEEKFDVSGIHLEGESEDEVPVYDTCNELRRKLRLHLAKPGVTKAGFAREIAKTYNNARVIQGKQVTDFLGRKDVMGGNTSPVFYAGYVYFEKLRVKEKKPKSQMREEMEDIWGHFRPFMQSNRLGVDTINASGRQRYIVSSDKVPVMNKYGQIHSVHK